MLDAVVAIEWSTNGHDELVAESVMRHENGIERRTLILEVSPGISARAMRQQYLNALRDRTYGDRRSGSDRRSATRIDSLDRRSNGRYVISSPSQY